MTAAVRIRCCIHIQFGDPMVATEAEQCMTDLNGFQVCCAHARKIGDSGVTLDFETLARVKDNRAWWAL